MTLRLCSSFLSIALLSLAAACGDDDSSGRDRTVDAGTDQPDGAAQVTCPVEENPAAVASLIDPLAGQEPQEPDQQAEEAPVDPQLYFILGGVGDMDFVELELWDGFGAFAATEDKRVTPGTYTIEGDDASVDGCGICFFLVGDLMEDRSAADYIATAGTVTIDSIEGDLSGSAENVTFTQIDPETAEPVPGGCTATFPSIAFSAPIAPTE